MTKITIFGSCRQYSIKDNYEVSNIQENLNYPHYSNEIIQSINYCKYDNYINNNDTKYCFRTGLLLNKNIENNNLLKKEFEETDIFIIEIASRISYKWNNLYLHHIATDNKYNFPYINDIAISNETDDEIEKNLIKIKEILFPKPLIIISHFSTYSYGKRYELIVLLEKLTEKYNIPFFNPSILLKKHTKEQLFVNESVLSHYTELGNKIISNIYKNLIENINFKLKIILINDLHIGDSFFSQPIIKKFFNENKNCEIFTCLRYNSFIYSDIEGLKNIDYIPNLCNEAYIFDTYNNKLYINTWVYYLNKNLRIECNLQYINNAFKKIIDDINIKYNLYLKYRNDDIDKIELPSTDINKFIKFKNSNSQHYFLFYYNYQPKSGQLVSFQNHDNIIISLFNIFKNHKVIFILPNINDNIKNNVDNDRVINCELMFNCEENASCENVVKLLNISSLCNLVVVYDIGACMFYNSISFTGKVLHFGVDSYYYDTIKNNIKGQKFDSEFNNSHNDEEIIKVITSKIMYNL